jgi:hypothetical protein
MIAANGSSCSDGLDILQAQRLASSFESTFFSRPPRDQLEDGGQIAIDSVSVSARLALLPRISLAAGIISLNCGQALVLIFFFLIQLLHPVVNDLT